MAILVFQQPEKVIMVESDDYRGKFEFRPLEPGYGNTIGNALRRILLSSLEGYAITAVRIDGVSHEFDTIHGVVEDMTEIILNLKRLCFKRTLDQEDMEEVSFRIEGKTTFMAGDMNKYLNAFQVLNTDVEICHMTPEVTLDITLRVEKGRGYVPSEENVKATDPIGTIAIDSIFTPIKNVKYSVENYRVGQRTDYDNLIFEIETDGSILPKDALRESAQILIQHLVLFSDKKIDIQTDIKNQQDEFDEETLHIRQLLKTKLVDMDLSVRALNCLKAAGVDTLGDLVQIAKSDLLKFRNFGKKSLTELDNLVKSRNLDFGN
ncbi:MAG: DNA-directed RNA polymerase subunit alpha [Bacteroidota bacterium]|nr:DNA-directed RNA polymerase subunit alpha [Bacteroidota bacterium]